jgi:hypothetical protein
MCKRRTEFSGCITQTVLHNIHLVDDDIMVANYRQLNDGQKRFCHCTFVDVYYLLKKTTNYRKK